MSTQPAVTEVDRWTSRPGLARLIRAAVWLVPFTVATVVALVLSMVLPPASGWTWGVARLVVVAAAATLVMRGLDRLVRRTLPLAALLDLTLVFPDRAPSRVAMAMRAASSTELSELLDRYQRSGAAGPARAAEHLLDLVAALSRHDRVTRGHSERVRAYAQMIGAELGLSGTELDRLRWAGLIHDIGKLRIDAAILNKPGRLTDDEFAVIVTHPDLGAELAAPLAGWLGESVLAVAQHHEKWDGTGYPRRLRGEEISLAARIVAVADVFDVITSVRSYQQARSAHEARAELARCAGMHFDPDVVRAFLNISLGRLRRVMGPLSWLTSMLVVAKPVSAASSGQGASQSAGATSTTTTTTAGTTTATTTTTAGTATAGTATAGTATVGATTTTTAASAAATGTSVASATAAASGTVASTAATATAAAAATTGAATSALTSGLASFVAAATGSTAAVGATTLAGLAATGLGVVAAPMPVAEPMRGVASVTVVTVAAVPAPGDPVQTTATPAGAASPVAELPMPSAPAGVDSMEVSDTTTTPVTVTAVAVTPITGSPITTVTSTTTAPPTVTPTTTAPPTVTSTTAPPVSRPTTTAVPALPPEPVPAPTVAAPAPPLPPPAPDDPPASSLPPAQGSLPDSGPTDPGSDARGTYVLAAPHDGDAKSTSAWALERREARRQAIANLDADRDDLPGLTLRRPGEGGGKDEGGGPGNDRWSRFVFTTDRRSLVRGDMTVVLHLRAIDAERDGKGPLEASVDVHVQRCSQRGECSAVLRARVDVLTDDEGAWPEVDERSFPASKVSLGRIDVELGDGEHLELWVAAAPGSRHDVVLAFDAEATPSALYLS